MCFSNITGMLNLILVIFKVAPTALGPISIDRSSDDVGWQPAGFCCTTPKRPSHRVCKLTIEFRPQCRIWFFGTNTYLYIYIYIYIYIYTRFLCPPKAGTNACARKSPDKGWGSIQKRPFSHFQMNPPKSTRGPSDSPQSGGEPMRCMGTKSAAYLPTAEVRYAAPPLMLAQAQLNVARALSSHPCLLICPRKPLRPYAIGRWNRSA
jgi:hypothetical protein